MYFLLKKGNFSIAMLIDRRVQELIDLAKKKTVFLLKLVKHVPCIFMCFHFKERRIRVN